MFVLKDRVTQSILHPMRQELRGFPSSKGGIPHKSGLIYYMHRHILGQGLDERPAERILYHDMEKRHVGKSFRKAVFSRITIVYAPQ